MPILMKHRNPITANSDRHSTTQAAIRLSSTIPSCLGAPKRRFIAAKEVYQCAVQVASMWGSQCYHRTAEISCTILGHLYLKNGEEMWKIKAAKNSCMLEGCSEHLCSNLLPTLWHPKRAIAIGVNRKAKQPTKEICQRQRALQVAISDQLDSLVDR